MGSASVLFQVLAHALDGGADLERGAKLDRHGGHEVIGLEQHERLAVDLLELEVLHIVGTPGQRLDEVAHLRHRPLQGVVDHHVDVHHGMVVLVRLAGHGARGGTGLEVHLGLLAGGAVAQFVGLLLSLLEDLRRFRLLSSQQVLLGRSRGPPGTPLRLAPGSRRGLVVLLGVGPAILSVDEGGGVGGVELVRR